MVGLDGPSGLLQTSRFFETREVEEHWEAEMLWQGLVG